MRPVRPYRSVPTAAESLIYGANFSIASDLRIHTSGRRSPRWWWVVLGWWLVVGGFVWPYGNLNEIFIYWPPSSSRAARGSVSVHNRNTQFMRIVPPGDGGVGERAMVARRRATMSDWPATEMTDAERHKPHTPNRSRACVGTSLRLHTPTCGGTPRVSFARGC